MQRRDGFTLLEVQVAIAVLFVAVAGLGAVLMNDLKQLEWLEQRRPLYAAVSANNPPDARTFAFSAIFRSRADNKITYLLNVTAAAVYPSSQTATVELTPFK